MPWGIFIPADEAAPLEFRLFGQYTDYQEAVGGTFQSINLGAYDATYFVNEEGKNIHLPLNRRATLALWLHNRAFMNADVIAGDIVIVGPPDDEGDTQDVPDALVALLMRTDIYRYEVETVEKEGKWYGNMTTFDNYFEACNAALGLLQRWTLAANVRVLAR